MLVICCVWWWFMVAMQWFAQLQQFIYVSIRIWHFLLDSCGSLFIVDSLDRLYTDSLLTLTLNLTRDLIIIECNVNMFANCFPFWLRHFTTIIWWLSSIRSLPHCLPFYWVFLRKTFLKKSLPQYVCVYLCVCVCVESYIKAKRDLSLHSLSSLQYPQSYRQIRKNAFSFWKFIYWVVDALYQSLGSIVTLFY